jgi:hypothetical protein
MMSYLLNKLLADNDGNNLAKFAPLVIFFVIWLFSAIAKSRAGKKGEVKELPEGSEEQEPSFDDLAKKIRERYSAAKEQARRAAEQDENDGRLEPPARMSQPDAAATPYRGMPPAYPAQPAIGPKPPMFEVARAAGQPQIKKPAAYPTQSTSEHEGPTLKVVKGLQQANVGGHLTVEKPTLQKVEPGLQRVDALTSENAKASGEVEIIHHQYLSELGEQYSSADGFRKAILNYEILGPPVSLRCEVDTQNEAF